MKLGPSRFTRSSLLLVATAALSASCGYRSAYDRGPRAARLSLAGAELASPHPAALEAALAGARAELSRLGALAPGAGYPRMAVEVLRVDEVAVGIHVTGSGPLASGSSVGVTARAWVVSAAGAEPEAGTGDVRRVVTVAQGESAGAAREAFEDATVSAARRAGQALALRVLGIVEPAVEPM